MMNEKTRLARHPGAITADVGGDIIFLHEGEGAYYSLSEVGALAWKTLESPCTLADVVAAVAEEYDAPQHQIRDDLVRFFGELDAKGLVLIDPPADR